MCMQTEELSKDLILFFISHSRYTRISHLQDLTDASTKRYKLVMYEI